MGHGGTHWDIRGFSHDKNSDPVRPFTLLLNDEECVDGEKILFLTLVAAPNSFDDDLLIIHHRKTREEASNRTMNAL